MKSIILALFVMFGMIITTSCTSEMAQQKEEKFKLEKITGSEAEAVKQVVLAYLKGTTCESCKGNSCRVVGFYQVPDEPAGVGAYHVVCNSGNTYECIYNCDGSIDVYPGGSTVPIPHC